MFAPEIFMVWYAKIFVNEGNEFLKKKILPF